MKLGPFRGSSHTSADLYTWWVAPTQLDILRHAIKLGQLGQGRISRGPAKCSRVDSLYSELVANGACIPLPADELVVGMSGAVVCNTLGRHARHTIGQHPLSLAADFLVAYSAQQCERHLVAVRGPSGGKLWSRIAPAVAPSLSLWPTHSRNVACLLSHKRSWSKVSLDTNSNVTDGSPEHGTGPWSGQVCSTHSPVYGREAAM